MADTSHAGTTRPHNVAVLLAAGAGSRFADSGHKLLAALPSRPGTTVAGSSLRHVLEADVGPLVIVTGALDEAAWHAATDTRLLLEAAGGRVRFVHNRRWSEGQAGSLRVAVAHGRDVGAEAIVVGLADQPGVPATAWRTVAAGTGPITVATYDGERAHPVRLARETWELLPTEGDLGARNLMRMHPELVTGVPCTGSSYDIDTVEDLQRWQSN